MDILLIILWSLLCIVWLVGSVLPVLPWPLLGYIALIFLQLTSGHPFSWVFFIVWAVIIWAMTVMDYLIPARGTKKFGGTKAGIQGSNIGLLISTIILPILGIVIGPFGIVGLIAWPFLWSYIGEKVAGKHHAHALKAAIWSFIGFLTGTLIKIVVMIIITGYYFVNVYKLIVK